MSNMMDPAFQKKFTLNGCTFHNTKQSEQTQAVAAAI
jgi:hypothetical protein